MHEIDPPAITIAQWKKQRRERVKALVKKYRNCRTQPRNIRQRCVIDDFGFHFPSLTAAARAHARTASHPRPLSSGSNGGSGSTDKNLWIILIQ